MPHLTLDRGAAAERPFHTSTAIEPSDAAERIYSALVGQLEMVTPRTAEWTGTQLATSLASYIAGGAGATGAGMLGTVSPSAERRAHVEFAFPSTYPLAAPTGASAALTAIPDASWELASLAGQALVESTPLVGLTTFAEMRPSAQRTGTSAPASSRAYRTFTQLAEWLGMTQEETAHSLGVGRTTPLAWGRGHEPRPARARRLYQTHALLSTLVRRLGIDETRRWLARGEPSPLDLIKAGEVAAADDRAEALIFGARVAAAPRLDAWVDESAARDQPPAPGTTPRRVSRPSPRRRGR